MKSSWRQIALLALLSLVMGMAMRPLNKSISASIGQDRAVKSLNDLATRAGQGTALAILGGYRSIVANMVWITMLEVWRKGDFDETLLRIRMATSIDPRPETFWVNGARIIANDMPVWKIGLEKAAELGVTERGIEIQNFFVNEALELLEKGIATRGESAAIRVEQAFLQWNKLEDKETAIWYLDRAIEQPDAPSHAFRIRARLLEELGRKKEALASLKAHFQSLPENDINVFVLREWIRRLEHELSSVV